MLCFRNFLVAKKFEDKKLGVVSKFYVKTFLSQSAEKIRRGTRNTSVLCFRKFLVAKFLWKRRGEYHNFPSEIFVSQCRKGLRGTL